MLSHGGRALSAVRMYSTRVNKPFDAAPGVQSRDATPAGPPLDAVGSAGRQIAFYRFP